MPVPRVQELPGLVFDDLARTFPAARLESPPFDSESPDRPSRYQVLLFDDQYCGVILLQATRLSQLVLVSTSDDAITTRHRPPLFAFVGGFSKMIPITRQPGKGYALMSSICMTVLEAMSLPCPYAEMLGYLVIRCHQTVRDANFVRTTLYESDLWPERDYSSFDEITFADQGHHPGEDNHPF
jgi:hypothetical protein